MHRFQRDTGQPESEAGLRGLWLGILAYRWASLVWMGVLAFTSRENFRHEELAWAAIGAAAIWTTWLTASQGWLLPVARGFDLTLAVGLLLISGLVMNERSVVLDFPFFATAYPVSAVMTVAAASGVGGGLLSGLALSVALIFSRSINGVPLANLGSSQMADIGNGVVYYLSAGGAVGLVSRFLRTSAAEIRSANEQATKERERAARLAERESLGRKIHDSVLQALAMVHKRGRELGAQTSIAGHEVHALAEMAAQQERALRALIQDEPAEAPSGKVSLRTVLEASAYGVTGVPVTITTVGTVWLATDQIEELSAAVRQALENVAQHAGASRASLFADQDGSEIVVSVRDDGKGFDYDEAVLRDAGKMGVLKSMKGRIEDLGGVMQIHSGPGAGTEVEFRIPAEAKAPR